MTKTFKEKWFDAVESKNSVLCAGLDPADFKMDMGEKGLPEGINKQDWTLDFLEAVAPFCSAVKYNIQCWKDSKDNGFLDNMIQISHDLGLVVIEDSKLADIGSSNYAGLFYAKKKNADAVTFSPFAGNIQEASKQAKKREIGLIGMCLMSNSGYEKEKGKLVLINKKEYFENNFLSIRNGNNYTKQYIQLAHDSEIHGLDGIVVGAPSENNHIQKKEIKTISKYFNGLILVPGIGEQGGKPEILFKYFAKDNLIINVGRNLMFPKGSNSTPKEQEEVAEEYRDKFNQLR